MTEAKQESMTGGCLCGAVRYAVEPPLLRANHCHCSRCRKHSGTTGCMQARVLREQFQLLSGHEELRVYGRGKGAVKAFCRHCGSSIFGGNWPDGPQVSIRLGSFDADKGELDARLEPQFHTFVDSKAPWDRILDDLPQYPNGWSKDAVPLPNRDRRR